MKNGNLTRNRKNHKIEALLFRSDHSKSAVALKVPVNSVFAQIFKNFRNSSIRDLLSIQTTNAKQHRSDILLYTWLWPGALCRRSNLFDSFLHSPFCRILHHVFWPQLSDSSDEKVFQLWKNFKKKTFRNSFLRTKQAQTGQILMDKFYLDVVRYGFSDAVLFLVLWFPYNMMSMVAHMINEHRNLG